MMFARTGLCKSNVHYVKTQKRLFCGDLILLIIYSSKNKFLMKINWLTVPIFLCGYLKPVNLSGEDCSKFPSFSDAIFSNV